MRPIEPLDWDLGNVPPGIAWGGVDEAGRGAWAGPVVAACAVLDHETVRKWGHVLRAARDSKKLSPGKREGLAMELKRVLPAWSVAVVDNLAIDRENILQATLDVMRQAVKALEVRPRMLFVDGDHAPRTGLPERLLVEGDRISCVVACASILAKTHRDGLMRELDQVFPVYGFAAHKGYGTPVHQDALKAHGACPVHRLSYAPVAARQQTDAALLEGLEAEMQACDRVESLQAWVETRLRPEYGKLSLAWVETLREHYAHKLAVLARPS
ncbi:MAG: ribonuclease HII [Firmicutes bacterium]|nr:ribonuclease HII [Bacillota bacterium]